MSMRRRRRELRKQQRLGGRTTQIRRRKSRAKNPSGLPKGSWPAPDGGYYLEAGRRGPAPPDGRRIIVTGKRRTTVDIDRLIAAAWELHYTKRKTTDPDQTD